MLYVFYSLKLINKLWPNINATAISYDKCGAIEIVYLPMHSIQNKKLNLV